LEVEDKVEILDTTDNMDQIQLFFKVQHPFDLQPQVVVAVQEMVLVLAKGPRAEGVEEAVDTT
jgi:hypothetical protein